MSAPRDDVDFDKIIELHLAGETILKLAADFGVSRPTIIRRLRRAEVPIRSRSEAALLRYERRPGEGQKVTAAAHEASRGRVKTHAEQVKRANSREAHPPSMSRPEAQFAAWLDERDVPYRREVAVDKYNIDFAVASVAVEILGGEWHGTRRKAARHSERTPHILGAGWSLLFIWDTPSIPLTPSVADYTVTLLESVRSDPTLVGEYRVVSGEAHLLARGRAEDYKRTGVPTPRRRTNAAR